MRARAAEQEQEKICFDDGSYLIVQVMTKGGRSAGSISASKPYTYYNSNGTAQWQVALHGSFTYDGSSARCTSASVSVDIYNSSWYNVSKNASRSGNTAHGSATMGLRSAGVTVMTVPVTMTLTCDANGNLS